jgi:hypothetical protein
MKNSIVRPLTLAALFLASGIASGCELVREELGATAAPQSSSISPRVRVALEDSTAVVTLVMDVVGDVGGIGSFTGRVTFDPAGLLYDGEVALTDGTMRASNLGDGVIRVAGASMNGVDVSRLAAFRFKVLNRASLDAIQFSLEELHSLTQVDLREQLRAARGTLSQP